MSGWDVQCNPPHSSSPALLPTDVLCLCTSGIFESPFDARIGLQRSAWCKRRRHVHLNICRETVVSSDILCCPMFLLGYPSLWSGCEDQRGGSIRYVMSAAPDGKWTDTLPWDAVVRKAAVHHASETPAEMAFCKVSFGTSPCTSQTFHCSLPFLVVDMFSRAKERGRVSSTHRHLAGNSSTHRHLAGN